MHTPDPSVERVTSTPGRGWAVLLLFRAQGSSVILVSYTFGLFLPFIRDDLDISLLQAGLLQGVWWVTAATFALPFSAWLSRFRPVPVVLLSLILALLGVQYPEFGDLTWFQQQAQRPSDFSHISFGCGRLRA